MVARAGQLREWVTIQALTTSPDGQGGFTEAWGDIGTTPNVFARVQPLSGAERVAAMQIDARASHSVTVRYRSDITTAHRIKWGTRYLYPVGPWLNDDERGVLLTASCREDTD